MFGSFREERMIRGLAWKGRVSFHSVRVSLAFGIAASVSLVGCSPSPDAPPDSATQPGENSAADAAQLEDTLRDRCTADSAFAWVPSGDFISGSDAAERDVAYRLSAEGWASISDRIPETPEAIAQAEQQLRQRQWFDREPEREERSLSGFCISRNLVTNVDYLDFVNATGHRPPGISEADYQAQGFLVHPYEDVEPYLWQNGTHPTDREQHPVVLVSYDDAVAYADWRGEQDGVTYRLPTALEWEKAARSTDGRYFPWGNDWQDEATNWIGSGDDGTSAIAAYPLSRSPYGVEDMAGNVFEFTSTLLERGEQAESPRMVAVMKGCSWDDLPGFCRAAYRHTRPIESRHILFGFRLLRDHDLSSDP